MRVSKVHAKLHMVWSSDSWFSATTSHFSSHFYLPRIASDLRAPLQAALTAGVLLVFLVFPTMELVVLLIGREAWLPRHLIFGLSTPPKIDRKFDGSHKC